MLVCLIPLRAITGNSPVAPVEPGSPGDPEAPTEPVEPTDPVGPGAPAEPVGPVEPAGPGTPEAPVAPWTPLCPGTPTEQMQTLKISNAPRNLKFHRQTLAQFFEIIHNTKTDPGNQEIQLAQLDLFDLFAQCFQLHRETRLILTVPECLFSPLLQFHQRNLERTKHHLRTFIEFTFAL